MPASSTHPGSKRPVPSVSSSRSSSSSSSSSASERKAAAKRRPPPGPRQGTRQVSASARSSQAGCQTGGSQKPAANSGSRSSSSSSSASKQKAAAKRPRTSKLCEICHHLGHASENCPLVVAVQTGSRSQIRAAEKMVGPPLKPWWHKMTARGPSCVIPGELIIVPGDNNCLFTAMSLTRPPAPWSQEPQDLASRGFRMRKDFLEKLRQQVAAGDELDGLPLLHTVCDEAQPPGLERAGQNAEHLERYISHMTVADGQTPTNRQWGGFAEAQAIAHMWKFTLYIVARSSRGECKLFTQSMRPKSSKGVAVLVYSSGAHFNFLRVDSAKVLRPLDG